MYNQTLIQPTNALAVADSFSQSPRPIYGDEMGEGLNYWQFFSFTRAARSFLLHCYKTGKRPTFAETRKRNHTYRTYKGNLKTFLGWLNARHSAFPDENVLQDYIAFLRRPDKRGRIRSAETVNTYLAPVRVFLRLLAKTSDMPLLQFDNLSEANLYIQLRMEVDKQEKRLLSASAAEGLPPDETSSEGALWTHGKRLSQQELFRILQPLKSATTLREKRDFALWMVFVFTGLRVSSISRISLASLKEHGGGSWSITVLHKRRKKDPVACDALAIRAIQNYVDAYNQTLPDADPRRIGPKDPVWRRLTPRYGLPFDDLSVANAPMEENGIRDVIKKRSKAVGLPVTPHDLRRSLAATGWNLKMDIRLLSQQLCHSSLDQTAHYIGPCHDFTALNIANLDGFTLAAQLQ